MSAWDWYLKILLHKDSVLICIHITFLSPHNVVHMLGFMILPSECARRTTASANQILGRLVMIKIESIARQHKWFLKAVVFFKFQFETYTPWYFRIDCDQEFLELIFPFHVYRRTLMVTGSEMNVTSMPTMMESFWKSTQKIVPAWVLLTFGYMDATYHWFFEACVASWKTM